MIKKFVFLLLIFLTACSGGEDAVATSVALTVEALPTQTPYPTFTPFPTQTPEPTPEPLTATPELICSEQASEFTSVVDRLLEQWDDTNELANNTARIALSGPVGDLQDVKQQVSSLDAPECASDVKDTLLFYMETQIDVYLDFMEENETANLSFLANILRIAVDVSFPALRDGVEPERQALLVAFGTPEQAIFDFGISTVASHRDDIPWTELRDVEIGDEIMFTISSGNPQREMLTCLLVVQGILIDIQTNEGLQPSVTCEGVVE